MEETLEDREETTSMVNQEDLEQDQAIMGDFKKTSDPQDSQVETLEDLAEAQDLVKVDFKEELEDHQEVTTRVVMVGMD